MPGERILLVDDNPSNLKVLELALGGEGYQIDKASSGARALELVAELAPALDDAERDAVARYLPRAFAHLEAHELGHIPVATRWPEQGAAYGLCDGDDARTLFYETVTEVIVPQLEAHGLPAAEAW